MPVSPTQQPTAASAASLWRLRGYLKPHRWALLAMLIASLGGVAVSIAVPLVTKALIDGPITRHELGPALPLGLLAIGFGVLEAVFIFWSS